MPLPYHTFLGPIQHFGFFTGSLFASQSLKNEGERHYSTGSLFASQSLNIGERNYMTPNAWPEVWHGAVCGKDT